MSTITGNTVRNNNDGIGMAYTDRGTSETYGVREARNILVETTRSSCHRVRPGRHQPSSDDGVLNRMANRFVGNSYVNNTGIATPLAWDRRA